MLTGKLEDDKAPVCLRARVRACSAKESLENESIACASCHRPSSFTPVRDFALRQSSRPFPMINVSRDSPRYHLLLVARFTRIDHGSEFYTGSGRPSGRSLNLNDRSINFKEDLSYIARSRFSLPFSLIRTHSSSVRRL